MSSQSNQEEHDRNEAAFWREKDELAQRYPAGWFIAYSGGKIIADAADFDTLHANLLAMGKYSPEILAVEAGVDYPKEVVIL